MRRPAPPTRRLLRLTTHRLRPRLVPILQTGAAAVAAYYLSLLLPLQDPKPVFASIAAVVSLGATFSHRGRRAVELVGGVVLGLTVAALIVRAIGVGPLQIGLMVVLAMSVAVLLRGGELLVSEAAVSALLLALVAPSSDGLTPDRLVEALVGAGVGLATGALLFPPDPALLVSRAAQDVFARLGRTLEEIAAALAGADADRATRALEAARSTDPILARLRDELVTAQELARLSSSRNREARAMLGRYSRTLIHLDFAVRNTRVLARDVVRHTRGGAPPPAGLPLAVGALAEAVWELAAAHEDPRRAPTARAAALSAAGGALAAYEDGADRAASEIAGHVRSAAVDLMRAAELTAESDRPAAEVPTEELLAAT